MRKPLVLLAVFGIFLALVRPALAAEPEPTPKQVKAAIVRALEPLQTGATEYTYHRDCFSCHNQALPLLALSTAKARGFEVSDEVLRTQVQFTADSLAKNRADYQKGRGQGGQADTAGYALLALDVGDWKPDATTAAVAEYLILRDKDQGHWKAVANRPPSEVSPFTTTYLAIRGLRKFGTTEQQERITARIDQARRWLLDTPAKDTEDRVSRLLALKFAGAEGEDLKAATQELLQTQRKDGGWAQTDKLESDAYATGSALVALHQAGGLKTSDEVYQRGLRFLIQDQKEDGSWLVRSRSRPFQTYFESGFPHGKDQFISSAASGWAMTALALAAPRESKEPTMEKLWVYIGTYTGKNSKGIYRCELDLATGKLSAPKLAGEATNPSFLAIHPNQRFLYAVGEVSSMGDKKTGGVSAFAIDAKTGDLSLLNQQSSGGAGPCHLVVDKQGKNALAANYGAGSASVLPIGADGKLGEATTVVQHEGKSVNPKRQEAPHAHSINLDAGNRFAFVADLGLDKVMVYRFDPAKGTLKANDPPSASVAGGAGPRHFAFHPNGKNAYVINELANTVTAFSYDADKGTLKELQTVTTLPKDFMGTSYTAEVVVHPSGKFLYGSNRGHDSIAVFAIAADGKLTPTSHQTNGIKWPRNFNIDPTGTYLLAANERADSVVVFRIDPKTGELKPTESKVEVASPVCVKVLPMPK